MYVLARSNSVLWHRYLACVFCRSLTLDLRTLVPRGLNGRLLKLTISVVV